MSDLVGNPEDRFHSEAAHMSPCITKSTESPVYPDKDSSAKLGHPSSLDICQDHTCDTFLSPNRDVWNFWLGNSCQISGGFHVANFGLFYRSLKVAKSSDNCQKYAIEHHSVNICQPGLENMSVYNLKSFS